LVLYFNVAANIVAEVTLALGRKTGVGRRGRLEAVTWLPIMVVLGKKRNQKR
jgi:hypothetical protein